MSTTKKKSRAPARKQVRRSSLCYVCLEPIEGKLVEGVWIKANPDGTRHECSGRYKPLQ